MGCLLVPESLDDFEVPPEQARKEKDPIGWLNENYPAVGIFTVTSVPPGFPPDSVRQSWVGKSLPVRPLQEPVEGMVQINAWEAMLSLVKTDPEAFDYWMNYFESTEDASLMRLWREAPEVAPIFALDSCLKFSEECGELKENTPPIPRILSLLNIKR